MRTFFMMALMGVATAHAAVVDTQLDTLKSVELQDVQVVSTRAQDANGLYQHEQGTAEGRQLRQGRSLPAVVDTLCDDDLRRR